MNTPDQLTLPFHTEPNALPDAPDIMMPTVWHCLIREASITPQDVAPWSGYYAVQDRQAVSLIHKCRIWFEIRQETSTMYADEYYMFHVADPELLIVHHPEDHTKLMNSNRLGKYTHIRSVCERCAVGVNLVQKQVKQLGHQ